MKVFGHHIIAVCTLVLILCGTRETRAQILSAEAWRGAGLGGLIGGIIGHNSGRRTTEGIGIGAVSGAVLGTLTSEREHYDTYIPSRSQSRYADAPYGVHRPHHAVTGAAVGAVAGGIIGHNSGNRTMEGVGIGAASGLAIGALVEHAQRRRANQHYFAEEARPGRSTVLHAVPATAKPSTFPQPIRTREVRDGAIITTSSAAWETSSTLIRTIPDHTSPRKPATTTAKKPIAFKYLGHQPRK